MLSSSNYMEIQGIEPLGRLLSPRDGDGAQKLSGSSADKDASRVKRAQAGDKSVWDEWFSEYYRPLFRYSYLRLRSKSEAEDVVSQVFVEAYRGIGRYKHTGKPLLAWLYRIAHNVIYDRLKAESRRPEAAEDGDGALALGEGPEAKIVSIDLLNAIDGLTAEQRDVIILRYFMSMSSVEVGALLGKTQPAVFSLQSRALASLRNKLDGVMEL
jgi:RNA polymerase sigma-70 factor (ECF subfamily)